jgi:hypothetical protein
LTYTTFLLYILLMMMTLSDPAGCNCNNDELGFAPLDCETSKPTDGNLFIKLSINSQNQKVPITVFRGNFEDNNVVLYDTLSATTVSYTLSVDEYYSVTARYFRGQDTILVIDADRITTDQTDYKDKSCWTVSDGKVDVRLKF